jgi:hypothetical protein
MGRPEFQYEKGRDVLLLGNGINNLSRGKRWEDLLLGLDPSINVDEKPYPLAFEEIVIKEAAKTSPSDYSQILRNVKDKVAEFCKGIPENSFHGRLSALKVSDFMTTNYDYLIEKALNPSFMPSGWNKSEFKHSIGRHHEVNGKKIWHIHGEIDNGNSSENSTRFKTASILIGHEHYGDYYRRLHEVLKGNKDEVVGYLGKDVWLRNLFTRNVHIAGLGLDLSEFHIWWLIAFRARLREQYRAIGNKIIYHYASYDTSGNKKAKARLDLLSSFGVELEKIEINDEGPDRYERYWDDFFQTFNEKIKKHQ